MSLVTVTKHCGNGHKCTNRSHCVNDKSNKLDYNCDCEEKNIEISLAKLVCSHEDEGTKEYCSPQSDDDAYAPISFCTNFGSCKAKISADKPHPGCNCRPKYSGSYCQYRSTVDENLLPRTTTYDEVDNYSDGYAYTSEEIAFITIVLLCGVLLAVAVFPPFTRWRRRRNQRLDASVLNHNLKAHDAFADNSEDDEEEFEMYEMQQKGTAELKAKMEFV